MSNITVLATSDPNNQPQWLTVLPDTVKGQLVQQFAALKPEDQRLLSRGFGFITPDMMAACETVEDAMEMLKATAEGIATDDQANYIPPVYTVNHKTQRFQDDAGDTIKGSLRAVILHFQPTRGFFIEGRKLPLCSALGNLLNGTAQKDAEEAWSGYQLYQPDWPIDWAGCTHDCTTCHFNDFGSDPKTGSGKACKEKYRLFLALVDADGNLTGEGVMMNVPTTSMKNWDTYVSGLKRHKDENGKVQPLLTLQVVTEFSLEKAQGQGQDYAKIIAKTMRVLSGAEYQMVYAQRKAIVKVADKIGVEVGESYDVPPEPGAAPMGADITVPQDDNGSVPF